MVVVDVVDDVVVKDKVEYISDFLSGLGVLKKLM